MVQIFFYDRSSIDQLVWPDTEEGRHARDFLLPMIKEGVQAYIHNVETKLYLLQVNSHLIPITVNEREYNNSYLTSNYFPIKFLQERLSKNSSRWQQIQKPFITGAGLLLKGMKINKVVIVNNWLLTTNIYPNLSEDEIHALTDYLIKRYPDHALIFRSLNTRKCSALATCLEKQRYRLIYSRHVFIYDPEQKQKFSSKVLYHHRRDRRLIDTDGYEVIHSELLNEKEASHLLELYNELYLTRHTSYSPQFTKKYLQNASEKGFLRLVCLKKEGQIHGVIGFHERDKTLITPFCGYDQSKGEANHLYRMLTVLAIDEAEKRDIILNDGSGGAAPKQYRGMRPFPEYIALYDKHLPALRRLFWGMAEKMVKRFALSKINEAEE